MELAVLSKSTDPHPFQPTRLVEGDSSLIWTERFTTAGDFQRVSQDIAGTLSQLPLWQMGSDGNPVLDSGGRPIPANTIVTLRDSTVPMLVETHQISKSLTGAPQITTAGRSLETILDRRSTITSPVINGQKISPFTDTKQTAVDFVGEVIKKIINDGSASSADIIPEFTFVDGSGNPRIVRPSGYTNTNPATSKTADLGELYSWALGQVTSENYGLRVRRPPDLGTTKFTLEIYTGVDRTFTVTFDARFDQFDSSTYLLSQMGWKNIDQVIAVNDCLEVDDGSIVSSRTGFNRRVAYLDATSTLTAAAGNAGQTQSMGNLGTVDLAKQLETTLFSGEVSRQMGAKYGQDYFLGDIVRLTGDYGLSQFVRVAEFIRSEDTTGEKAYPTFASL